MPFFTFLTILIKNFKNWTI